MTAKYLTWNLGIIKIGLSITIYYIIVNGANALKRIAVQFQLTLKLNIFRLFHLWRRRIYGYKESCCFAHNCFAP